jgi:hypothetical protein
VRSGFLSLVVLLLAMGLPADAQESCSSPEELVQLSQGTFLGAAVGEEGDGDQVTVTFEVEVVFSGPIPSDGTVDVRVPAGEWDGRAGTVGIIVNREDASWVSDACRLLDPVLLSEIAPTSISPASLGENERETLEEPPLWIFFAIFGGGIGAALLVQRRRERRPTG